MERHSLGGSNVSLSSAIEKELNGGSLHGSLQILEWYPEGAYVPYWKKTMAANFEGINTLSGSKILSLTFLKIKESKMVWKSTSQMVIISSTTTVQDEDTIRERCDGRPAPN